MNEKISKEHLGRQAIVYIRQSTPQQIRNNRESAERQYALVERAASFGWPKSSIQTIDEDQGRSGASAAHRNGFKKLIAEIGAGQVGMVLALEASRLARSSADWQRLVEICVVTRTLLADEGAVYDPRDSNDRLLLGLKGTISEAELFTLRCRLHAGRWNKARRGELTRALPVGFVLGENGQIIKDPDRQVRSRLSYVFNTFSRVRVARKVVRQLREEGFKIPRKEWGGPRHEMTVWKAPTVAAIVNTLRNPTYAGAYVFGQREYDSFNRSEKTGKGKTRSRRLEDWPVCIHDAFPGYISWEQFLENRRVLKSNSYKIETRGAPRDGSALLQGIVFCGHCGSRMEIHYYSKKEGRFPWYSCRRAYREEGGVLCQNITSKGIDEAVADLFLRAVSPAKVEIALRALEALEAKKSLAQKEWELQIQHGQYEVDLAKKRYEAVDPQNRMVASELEVEWEKALQNLRQLQQRYQEFQQQEGAPITQRDRNLLMKLSENLKGVWNSKSTTPEDRKALLRFLVKRVHLASKHESAKIQIDIEWHTGAHSTLVIDLPKRGAPKVSEAVVNRMKELLHVGGYSHSDIAEILNQEKLVSAHGKPFVYWTVSNIIRSQNLQFNRGNSNERNTR